MKDVSNILPFRQPERTQSLNEILIARIVGIPAQPAPEGERDPTDPNIPQPGNIEEPK